MNRTQALERTRAVIRRQHKTLATEQTYLHWLRHYMAALGELPKTLTSEQKLERFLTEFAVKKNISPAATQNQAFNAILFSTRTCWGNRSKRWTPCAPRGRSASATRRRWRKRGL